MIFVEDPCWVKKFNLELMSSGAVIALEPNVQSEMEIRGIPYENSLPFFGVNGHKRILEKLDDLIKVVRSNFHLCDEYGVSKAYENMFAYFIRIYLCEVMVSLEIAHRAILSNTPDEIFVLSPSRCHDHGNKFCPNEDIRASVIQLYLEQNALPITLHHRFNNQNDQQPFSLGLFSYISTANWLRRIVFAVSLVGYGLFTKGKDVILATEDTYNMGSLLNDIALTGNGFTPVFMEVSRKNIKSSLYRIKNNETWSFIRIPENAPSKSVLKFNQDYRICMRNLVDVMHDNSELFKFRGADLRGIVEQYISTHMKDVINKLHGRSHASWSILKKKQPKLVVSQHSLGVGGALGELSNKLNIPAIVASHGSHPRHTNKYARIEWNEQAKTLINTEYQYVAIQSPLAKGFLEALGNKKSKPIVTGPLLFAKKRQGKSTGGNLRRVLFKKHEHKTILLHASSPRPRWARRLWVYETVDEYISNLNDLIKTIEQNNGIHLAIRFRPNPNFRLNDLEQLLVSSDCYSIYVEGSFDQYLLNSDILVSYSSTTIEEALQNKVVVLQYDADDKYSHIPDSEVFKKGVIPKMAPVYYAGNKADLRWGIKWLTDNMYLIKNNRLDWSQYAYNQDIGLGWLKDLL